MAAGRGRGRARSVVVAGSYAGGRPKGAALACCTARPNAGGCSCLGRVRGCASGAGAVPPHVGGQRAGNSDRGVCVCAWRPGRRQLCRQHSTSCHGWSPLAWAPMAAATPPPYLQITAQGGLTLAPATATATIGIAATWDVHCCCCVTFLTGGPCASMAHVPCLGPRLLFLLALASAGGRAGLGGVGGSPFLMPVHALLQDWMQAAPMLAVRRTVGGAWPCM
jgi:hypothetical protein